METRKGKYMETFTGEFFYPVDPRIEEVNIRDIAHGLSLICRFGGQCKYFYSVAQHCLNVSHDLKKQNFDEVIQLYGLLHDASEAYISDIVSPLKPELPDYKSYEKKIEEAIYNRFGLDYPTEEIHSIIKRSDIDVFCNEALVLMKNNNNWIGTFDYRKLNIDLRQRSMNEVEKEYIETQKRLSRKIK